MSSSIHADHADLIIVGGGMVGLGLACALRHSGLHIIIIERGEAPVFKSLGRDCRVSAIVMGNVKILQGLGVWDFLKKDAGLMRSMRIWDNQEQGGIRFEGSEIGEEVLGYLIENSATQRAMHKALLESDHVEFCSPAEIANIEWLEEHVEVKLADGRLLTTPLIVGADGGRSWVRQQAGIGVWERDYKQKGIVATVRPERGHNGIAYQRFLPAGPLAMLPMTDGLCSIVWSAELSEADRLMAMDESAFLDALNLTFGPVLGRISEVGERAAFPLIGRLAKHFVRQRVALVGDAAHNIHPLAGQGVNLGLLDVIALAQEIERALLRGIPLADYSILRRYQRQRLASNLGMMSAMEGFKRLFGNRSLAVNWLRNSGMRQLNSVAAVKKMIINTALGVS